MTRVREVWMGWLPSHWFIYGALSTWQASVALQMSTNWPRRAQREGAHVYLTLTSRVLLNPKRHAIAFSVDLEVTSGLLLKKIIHVVNNGHPSKPESRKFLQTVLKWSCPWNWRLLIQVFLLVHHLRLRRKRSDLCHSCTWERESHWELLWVTGGSTQWRRAVKSAAMFWWRGHSQHTNPKYF